ncbi:MAG: hypothetical protein AAB658_20740, partial [Chloroflexota bacterium]
MATMAYVVTGVLIGLGLGLATHLIAVWAKWQVSENLWFLVVTYVSWPLVCVIAMIVYGSVLLITE